MPFDSSNYQPIPEGHRRLLVLADFLETILDERFGLKVWAREGFEPNACGTVACACGWATTIPEFAALGLRLEYNTLTRPNLMLSFGRHIHTAAPKVFFGIARADVDHLFMIESYAPGHTKADVIARIRAFVAEQMAASKATTEA